MQNIAVFFGGVSVEHDISIITGVLTSNTLLRGKYNVIPIYVDRSGVFYTGESLLDLDFYKNPDYKSLSQAVILPGENKLYIKKKKKLKELCGLKCAINCMHGERGEDGSLAGLLNFTDIPFASPELLGSSVCMDKTFTKTVLKGLNVPVLPSVTVDKVSDAVKKAKRLGFPLIVKPCRLGSSIGVKKAQTPEELEFAVSHALRYGERAIIEPCLENFTEINCACYTASNGKTVVSECEQPIGKEKVLSFSDKYEDGGRIFPAEIEVKFSDYIKKTTQKVYESLNLTGIIRVDYMISGDKVYLNEINTVPGSLAYYLFSDTLTGFCRLLENVIDFACFKKAKENSFNKKFTCKVLDGKGIKSAKKL